MTTLAYLDAGTGSMMLQALLGGVAGLAVMGRVFRARLKEVLFFWRRPAAVAPVVEIDTAQGQEAPPHRS